MEIHIDDAHRYAGMLRDTKCCILGTFLFLKTTYFACISLYIFKY